MKLRKVTNSGSGASKRRYDDACGTAHALDLIGERWALLVMRELMLGPKRFSDLRGSLPGISANVLTQRLEGLEAAGILKRRKLPPPAPVQVYELTPWGYESEPIFQALGRWAARSPAHDPSLPLSSASLILSFRTMFDPQAAEGLDARYELRLGEDRFHAEVAEGRFEIERGGAERPDAIVESDPGTLAALVYEGRDLADALRTGEIRIEGDRPAVERFLTLFPMPEPASSAARV